MVIDRDQTLLRIIDEAISGAERRAGKWLACRPGCTECCVGPFPITQLDALRLRRALAELDKQDPARASGIRMRADASAASLESGFPGDPESGVLDCTEEEEERFLTRHEAEPCPVLNPDSGLCELYAARPITCRTFGPPVCFGADIMQPCRLCFTDAGEAEIEACRADLDPQDLEGQLLEELRAEGRQTLIAFALR